MSQNLTIAQKIDFKVEILHKKVDMRVGVCVFFCSTGEF